MVRRSPILLLFITAFFSFGAITAAALTIDASFDIGNLGFTASRSNTDTGLPTTTYPWGFRIGLQQPISDTLLLQTGVERDNLLGNSLYVRFLHRGQWATLAVGPYLGVLDSFSRPFYVPAGISSYLKAELWSAGYLSIEADQPLTSAPSSDGDYWQRKLNLAGGFYLPNIIASARIDTTERIETTGKGDITSTINSYAFETDIFQKNIPYRILLTFAYRNYIKDFDYAVNPSRQTMGTLVFGTKVTLDLGAGTSYYVRLDSALYTFGRDDLLGEFDSGSYIFRAQTGISLDLAALTDSRAKKQKVNSDQ